MPWGTTQLGLRFRVEGLEFGVQGGFPRSGVLFYRDIISHKWKKCMNIKMETGLVKGCIGIRISDNLGSVLVSIMRIMVFRVHIGVLFYGNSIRLFNGIYSESKN